MKRKTMGWLIVFLLFIVYMLNYMDRSALSITAPLIEKELGFNAAEMGMIFSAFFIGYALFNLIEASGANSAIRNTLDLASFAGRISFTGWPKQETSLPTNLITYKELDLRGSRTSAGEFDEALRMLSTLEINPQDVVSKVVNLDEIPDAVKELDRYPERYLKINAVFH